MLVKIYILNTQKSPRARSGTYGYVDVCVFHGETVTREGAGRVEGTRNQLDLTACVTALRKVVRPSEIELIGDLQWVACQVKYLEAWGKNGWKTSSGKEIKNKALWQQFWTLSKIHKITFSHSKHDAFPVFVTEILNKEFDKTKEPA